MYVYMYCVFQHYINTIPMLSIHVVTACQLHQSYGVSLHDIVHAIGLLYVCVCVQVIGNTTQLLLTVHCPPIDTQHNNFNHV